jgi:hypothetical protein
MRLGKRLFYLFAGIVKNYLIDVDERLEGDFTIGLIGVYGAWATSYLVVFARGILPRVLLIGKKSDAWRLLAWEMYSCFWYQK